MAETPFQSCPSRRSTDSIKWSLYGPDVLPLWVADMDVQAPAAVIEALERRISHGVFGYGTAPNHLAEAIVARLWRLYRWRVAVEDLVFVPGVMPGANLAAQCMTQPGDGILLQTPLYPPLRRMPAELGRERIEVDFATPSGQAATTDWERLRHAATDPRLRLFVLCNPQNPTGRVYTHAELTQVAEFCLQRDLGICSDEIHCDLVHSGHEHVPIASLSTEVADRTITLMAPSKTYNLAGFCCAFAVIQNRDLRARFSRARGSLVSHVDVLGVVAATAAYTLGDEWLQTVRSHLDSNRAVLANYLRLHLPGVGFHPPEGTYLGWLDCGQLALHARPFEFFLTKAKVALNDGSLFGAPFGDHVRINFGCTESLLIDALERMRRALGVVA